MITIILSFIAILFTSVLSYGQDLGGAPLPVVIPQEIHDFLADKAEQGKCIGSGDLIYWHFIACGHTVDVTNNEIVRARLNGRLTVYDTCGIMHVPRVVKIPGFVWKAVSERNEKPVMLVDSSYLGTSNNIRVIDVSLGFFANTQIDFANQDPELANGNRTHLRFNASASSYSNEILVQVRRSNNVVECFYINNPQTDVR